MERFEYAVALRRSPEGRYLVSCRDLPALVTQGDDRDDALAQAVDAMDEVFAALINLGLDYPLPTASRRGETAVAPPVDAVAKAALYVALRDAKVSKVDLARQLGIDEKEVHHPTAT